MLLSHFRESIHTRAMACVCCAEDAICRLAETLLLDGQSKEHCVLDLKGLKEELHSAMFFTLQTLRANSWYSLVLCENLLQELLSGVDAAGGPTQRHRRTWGTIPAWRCRLSFFLKKNPPPDTEELVHLAYLSNVVPGDAVQQAGKQMSERCMALRKLLISSGPVDLGHLQMALQWQYELLRSSHVNQSRADSAPNRTAKDFKDNPSESKLIKSESGKEATNLPGTRSLTAVTGVVLAAGKPPSFSSFDSGFHGAGSSQLEAWGEREGVEGLLRLVRTKDSVKPTMSHPQNIHEEQLYSVSDPVDHRGEFDLSPIRNVLSSTVTDERDESICTTEGIPSLLWDFYDLHYQNWDVEDG
ncbi:Hypothetical protein SMAX5B_021428 [Scophthalmus maximus]|uniref:Uncharacterized protein n=1 Tax=Scophthalmus maximus TaxID=52904 RepID=A0A2U9B1V4_SCOMX|nr:Hypothetical protein SMAX5B_021428 [Scophthalmus maximus]